jgi:hypothetical protein
MTTNFFHPSLLLLFLDPGSEIRDPGWVKIRIRDPGLTSRIRNTEICTTQLKMKIKLLIIDMFFLMPSSRLAW